LKVAVPQGDVEASAEADLLNLVLSSVHRLNSLLNNPHLPLTVTGGIESPFSRRLALILSLIHEV
jgi:hypothetical protein